MSNRLLSPIQQRLPIHDHVNGWDRVRSDQTVRTKRLPSFEIEASAGPRSSGICTWNKRCGVDGVNGRFGAIATDITQPSTDMYSSSRPSLLQCGSAPPPAEICHCVPVTGSGSTNTCGPPGASAVYAMNFESGENWACIEFAEVVGRTWTCDPDAMS